MNYKSTVYSFILLLPLLFSCSSYSYSWPAFDKKTAIVAGSVGLCTGIVGTWFYLSRYYARQFTQRIIGDLEEQLKERDKQLAVERQRVNTLQQTLNEFKVQMQPVVEIVNAIQQSNQKKVPDQNINL